MNGESWCAKVESSNPFVGDSGMKYMLIMGSKKHVEES
jgi:hypothetical protein